MARVLAGHGTNHTNHTNRTDQIKVCIIFGLKIVLANAKIGKVKVGSFGFGIIWV